MEQRWYIRDRGRVSGPFTLEQLQLMNKRGQFRRFHEVSEDAKSWTAASNLSAVFSQRAAPQRATVDEKPSEPAPAPEWFFIDRKGEQKGPVSRQQLMRLAGEGVLDGSSLVWNARMADWTPLAATEFAVGLPRGAERRRASVWRWLAPVIAGTACVIVVAGFLLRERFQSPAATAPAAPATRRPTFAVEPTAPVAADKRAATAEPAAPEGQSKTGAAAAATTPPAPDTRSAVISGLDRDDQLAAAVGLVVCGFHITQPTGRQADLALSTGTCFTVAPDGYLFTNKHVIEEISNWRHAELLLAKLRKEQLLEVKPTVWVFFKKSTDTRDKYIAEIVHISDRHDFGILKIDRSGPYFALSKGEEYRRGLKVAALGFPGNAKVPHSQEETMETIRRQKTEANVENQFKNRDFEFTLTSGTINRVVSEQEGRQWIEHSALLNPGNSGGPLVAEDGKVVGINTLLVKGEGGAIFTALGVHQLEKEINPRVTGLHWK